MKRKLRIPLLFLFYVLLSGCIDVDEHIYINSDGTARIDLTMTITDLAIRSLTGIQPDENTVGICDSLLGGLTKHIQETSVKNIGITSKKLAGMISCNYTADISAYHQLEQLHGHGQDENIDVGIRLDFTKKGNDINFKSIVTKKSVSANKFLEVFINLCHSNRLGVTGDDHEQIRYSIRYSKRPQRT